jgi:prophage maintenance system killer protein
VTAPTALTSADLRFINLVASRRFGGAREAAEPRGLDSALEAVAAGTPYARAAALAAELIGRSVFAGAVLPTALLAMVTQLERDGLELLAPQGAIVGMIRELASGEVDVATVARWLEDRAVPAASRG